ncbi:uncharacterized protein TEOVI_000452400 [Trypanosoma equiperdum]|uniref:Secreted protein n=1 Tax=Trypanosoma equiperdum TaxID=5694 RepID=A0A1G4IKB0_TRYEQ|nr:hypothetical protein TEOVI_000452400 [Trypanosoma equiperdum]
MRGLRFTAETLGSFMFSTVLFAAGGCDSRRFKYASASPKSSDALSDINPRSIGSSKFMCSTTNATAISTGGFLSLLTHGPSYKAFTDDHANKRPRYSKCIMNTCKSLHSVTKNSTGCPKEASNDLLCSRFMLMLLYSLCLTSCRTRGP